jgi:DHA2 family multidrug resistance protein
MMRNLGGSMGIAMTGTLLITRQSFHAMRNLENVSAFNPLVTERLDILEKFFLISGFDRPLSKTSSLGLMVFTAQKEALISAFGDVFKVLCVCLLICVGMIMVMMLFGKNNNNNSTFEMH